MKWTIHQLNQMPKKDFEFDETVDLSELSQSFGNPQHFTGAGERARRNPLKAGCI